MGQRNRLPRLWETTFGNFTHKSNGAGKGSSSILVLPALITCAQKLQIYKMVRVSYDIVSKMPSDFGYGIAKEFSDIYLYSV